MLGDFDEDEYGDDDWTAPDGSCLYCGAREDEECDWEWCDCPDCLSEDDEIEVS